MSRLLKAIVAFLALCLVASLAFLGGVLVERSASPYATPTVGQTTGTGSAAPGSDAGKLVDEVRGVIKREALKPSPDASITTNAVRGALDSLGDPYAEYFDPQAFERFQSDSEGEFFGIGITVQSNDKGQPYVVKPIDGTPAAKAGLKAGDIIVSIDGVTKAKWPIDDVVRRIRGPEGTKVKLTLLRPSTSKSYTVTLTRARINIPNVMSEMIGSDVGYMRLGTFNRNAADDIRAAITKLDGKGAKGFILDLRENPGGLLDVAVDVSSLFVKDGVIVRVDARGKPEEEHRASGDVATDKPLVVLVDGHSASASEIVAGALQDYARAKLVGDKSFGKGSVQDVVQLDNGGAVKLTVAHYLTPKKRVIDKKGVTPDFVVKMDISLQEDKKTDTQLQKALSVLRGQF